MNKFCKHKSDCNVSKSMFVDGCSQELSTVTISYGTVCLVTNYSCTGHLGTKIFVSVDCHDRIVGLVELSCIPCIYKFGCC